jgi:DNA polymerase I-like protein with 3'-5' exonuclease and polymerase domains
VTVGGRWLDVQIAEPLLDENRRSYKLEVLAQHYLGEGKAVNDLEDWAERAYGRGMAKNNIWRCPPSLVGPYGEMDAALPLRILDEQLPKLGQQSLTELWEVETDLLPMLLAMRRHGVRVDLQRAKSIDDELTAGIELAEGRLRALCGFVVNINAAAALAKAFDKAGVEYPKTDKGRPSFSKEWMEHHHHPLCQLIMEQRKLLKYRDTFIRGYIFNMEIGGRIHCLFHSMRGDENGTVSGRFSSSLPNLQNIPIRDEVWGPRIRSIFVPDQGCQWVRDDWSQIEYRFLVHFGRGKSAVAARQLYQEQPDTDFHAMVSELTGLGRKAAKNVNFGLVYGMGVPLLASTIGMTAEQAQREVFDVYHQRVPFVKETYDFASRIAKRQGFVTTVLGRRARFVERQFTHKALNRKLQGSAADLMKKAMVMIWRAGIYGVVPPAHLTVHDELDHSRPHGKPAREALNEVKNIMESAIELKVPIRADREVGPSWGECK